MPLRHYSASQISTYARCGMAWYYRYQKLLRIPPGVALIRGTAVHKGVEHALRAKLATQPVNASDVQDATRDAVLAKWGEGVTLFDDDPGQGEVIDTATSLASCYVDEALPAIEPIQVEAEFCLNVTGHDWQIVGFVDCHTPTAIRDTKTSARTPSQGDIDGSVQLSLYSLARHKVMKEDIAEVRFDCLSAMNKGPKYTELRSTRGPADWQDALNRLDAMDLAISKGVYMPCDRSSWACSERWCGYWKDTCPYGRKGRTI